MAQEQANSNRDELDSLRTSLQRLGFELNDSELERLAPLASAILNNGSRIAELDLSTIEPATTFDARYGL